MTEPELDNPTLRERLSEAIDTSIASEAARRNLMDGLTVEEADFCLGVVTDQVLEFLAKRYHTPKIYDEEQQIREQNTQELRNSLMGTLLDLVTERELCRGATPEEAEAAADAHNGRIFDDFLQKRDAIYSEPV